MAVDSVTLHRPHQAGAITVKHLRPGSYPRPAVRRSLHTRRAPGKLLRLPFFARWSADELEHFARVAEPLRFDVGEALVCDGDRRVMFMILADGEAEVSRAGVFVRRLQAGEHAAELALVDGTPATADVTASVRSLVLALYDESFYNLLESIPSLGRELLIAYTRELRGPVCEHQ
jgi:CRP-like cAMP-binding protein